MGFTNLKIETSKCVYFIGTVTKYYLVVDWEEYDYVFHRYNIIILGYFLLSSTPEALQKR